MLFSVCKKYDKIHVFILAKLVWYWDHVYTWNILSPDPMHSETLTKPIIECVTMFS